MCGFKAGGEAAVVRRRAVTWLLGRTWTGPSAGLAGGAVAEPVEPQSAYWEKAGVSDV